MVNISVIYHSEYGHTAVIAQAVAQGAKSANSYINLIVIDNNGDIKKEEWELLNSADAIIFGSVTHMGSVSWQFKKFMDASSKLWFKQAWKDKLPVILLILLKCQAINWQLC